LFIFVVILGVFSYFTLIIFITNKMKFLHNPQHTKKIIRVLGYVLIGFSLYFLFFALKALFPIFRPH
jgi:hypothetical protein